MATITGRKRFRKGWFGRLILQVEETHYHCLNPGGSGYFDEWESSDWRDAKLKDATVTPYLPFTGHADGGKRAAYDHIAGFINTLDTSEMTIEEFRKKVYQECMNWKV